MRAILKSCLRIALVFVVATLLLWVYMAQPTLTAHPRSAVSVDPERLRAHVVALSKTFFPRSYRETKNLDQSAEYIRSHFAEAGARISDQQFTAEGRTYRNVIGVFGARKPPKIVVGAHYDSHGITPGADDNASGVAGLIEFAYLLGRHGTDREIELVAYCLEEPPFFANEEMGSRIHVSSLKANDQNVAGAISLEMIGYFSDDWWSQPYPIPLLYLIYPIRGNYIAVVGRSHDRDLIKQIKSGMKGRTDLPVYSILAPEGTPGIDLSDHRSYWSVGIPAVMITDTAFQRNTEYHGKDTAERLDFPRMAKVVVSLFESIRELKIDSP